MYSITACSIWVSYLAVLRFTVLYYYKMYNASNNLQTRTSVEKNVLPNVDNTNEPYTELFLNDQHFAKPRST